MRSGDDHAASDISSLTTRVGTAEGDISSLATRVGTAEGDISALQGSVTGLGNDLADVKADLRDAICSVVEPDATADYAHAVDSYFWYNDTLYITTVAIAVGDTIVPNTNCNTTNVTTEIIKALTQSSSEIDDSVTALNKTWSSSKISDEIGDLSQLSTTDKTSTVNAINEVKSALLDKEEKGILLWTNNSPTTSFNAQNIPFPTNDCDVFDIYFWSVQTDSAKCYSIIPFSTSGWNSGAQDIYTASSNRFMYDQRNITALSRSGVTFGDNTRVTLQNGTITSTTNNATLVPFKVIGRHLPT